MADVRSCKILVLVEGQTEEAFVKKVLSPYYESKGLYLLPHLLTPRRSAGGIQYFGKRGIQGDVRKCLNDSSARWVTTMIDYYGLATNFPGYDQVKTRSSCFEKVECLEDEFRKDINHPRFLPYRQLHEFEALLFTSINGFQKYFPNKTEEHRQIEKVINQFPCPEEINEGKATHPSRRISDLFPEYQKTVHGSWFSSELGIDSIRARCPHFDRWLTRLET